MSRFVEIRGTPFEYYETFNERLNELHTRVQDMRRVGSLNPQVLRRIQKFFKLKGIYHSNAIEGNQLTIGETRLVVEMGMTLAGKTLQDQAEAKNLSEALDFMEEIAVSRESPILLNDLRQIHALILKGIDDEFAGVYRKGEVKISGSDYNPPIAHRIPQEMDSLGMYIARVTGSDDAETDLPILCAGAVHAWLAQIHPFVDGNGRAARILMNLILMRCGYPPSIITRDDRLRYYQALEESQASDLTALIELIYENVNESLEEWEKAAGEQEQQQEWLASVTAKFEQPELNRARNEYEVWRGGMALFRSYFKQTVDQINEQLSVGSVTLHFRSYGELDFQKYLSLRDGRSAKRTWDFAIIFQRGNHRVRYLFFYGSKDYMIGQRAKVILIIAKGIGYEYDDELLVNITKPNIPEIRKVGFDIETQSYVARTSTGIKVGTAEQFAKEFFTQVVQRDFGN